MSCSGPCQQGKKPCPCPQSCLKQEEAPPTNNDLLVALSIIIGVWVTTVIFVPMIVGFFGR